MAMQLGYWDIRGIVSQILYLLEYVGEEYEYKKWYFEWFQHKHTLGLEFPNLPYLLDGETKLSQSWAIMRYIARKHGLVAVEEKEIQTQDMLQGVLQDIRSMYQETLYHSPDWGKDREDYKNNFVNTHFMQLDKFLDGKTYLLGTKINYTDFNLFEQLDVHETLYPGLLDSYPNLKRYYTNFKNLESIKRFLESGKNPTAFNAPFAKWGGGGLPPTGPK